MAARSMQMKIWFLLGFLIFLPPDASADWNGWFGGGPNNYDECITESMKGVNSDLGAKAIIASCRKQFPPGSDQPKRELVALSLEQLKRLDFGGLSREISGAPGARYEGTFYNGNPDITVSRIFVSVTTQSNGRKIARDYVADVKAGPLSTAGLTLQIMMGLNDEFTTWTVIGAEGY